MSKVAAPRSSIRPAPADWRPRSDRPPPSPMVVVYSGDSERPPPSWDEEVASERPTFAHFVTVPSDHRQAPPQPAAGEPFLPAGNTPVEPSNEASAVESAAPAGDPRMSSPTLRLATWPSTGQEPVPLRHAATERKPAARRRWPFVVFGIIGLAGVGLALPSAPGEPPAPANQTTLAEIAAPAVATPATPERVEAPVATARASASTSAPETQGAPPPPPAESAKFQRVTLEVFPFDAKVVRRGMRQPGPPYSFKIPKGKTVSIEVAKRGFVTRKVVLDGSEATVVVGLFRKTARGRHEAAASSKTVGSGL